MRGRWAARTVAFLGVAVFAIAIGTRAESPSAPPASSRALVGSADGTLPIGLTTATSGDHSRSATVSFSGDVLLHTRVWRTAAANASASDDDGYDFQPMFEPIEPLVAGADWSVCHMEVNLDAENQNLASFPIFRGPGAVAVDLSAVGFDVCSTASNHSLDGRTAATFETIDVLEAAGIRAVGTARSAEEATTNVWFDIEGIRFAHLSYAYWFNGFLLPDDQPWAANQIDEQRILDDATAARNAGADFVMLSMHWGNEYRHTPSDQQAELGPRLLASEDIDLIIGHHAHVVQPIEQINGEWLVHGVGNLLSNFSELPRRDQLLVTATVVEQPDGTFAADHLEVVPVFLDIDTLSIWPSGPGIRPTDVSASLATDLEASWQRVNDVLDDGSGWRRFEMVGATP